MLLWDPLLLLLCVVGPPPPPPLSLLLLPALSERLTKGEVLCAFVAAAGVEDVVGDVDVTSSAFFVLISCGVFV